MHTLRQARERAELSQEQLAVFAWVSVRTVRRVEQGLVVPNMATRRALRGVLRRRLRDEALEIDWPATTAMREAA